MIKIRCIIWFVILFFIQKAFAQELNCEVKITLTTQVNQVDNKIFKTLEESISTFLNDRNWTDIDFQPHERINCNLYVNIRQELGGDVYKAEATIVSSRPVYGTNYASTVFNIIDKQWVFFYKENEPIEFAENIFTSNLSAMLSFYAYTIIGLDFETFGKKGGTEYLEKARNIALVIPQGLNVKGHNAFEGWTRLGGGAITSKNRNRYWLIDQILNTAYLDYRDALYTYHIQGLDILTKNPKQARLNILKSIKAIAKINKEIPNLYIIQLFILSKSSEILSIYKDSDETTKKQALQALIDIDPINAGKYKKTLK